MLEDWRYATTKAQDSGDPGMGLYQATKGDYNFQPQGTRTFSGIGGTFSQAYKPDRFGRQNTDTSLGGTWTSGEGGPQITDMPGFQRMKEQQRSGADFSMYGNRLRDLMSDPSKITQTPGYQFAVEQGNQAINRSAAAKGQLGGGGVLAELAKYGQGMASQEYGNEVNRLSSLIGQAQQFGQSSGYYQPEQYTPSLGIQQTGGGGGYRPTAPRPAAAIDYNSPMGYLNIA